MKKTRPTNRRINWIISGALILLYTATYAVQLRIGAGMGFMGWLQAAGTLLAAAVLLFWLEPLCFGGIALFGFVSQYLGAMLGLYARFPAYDLILHFVSGGLLAVFAYSLLPRLGQNAPLPSAPVVLWLCGSFSLAGAALWELVEFGGDTFFRWGSQHDLWDTMTDIFAGFLGDCLAIPLLWLRIRRVKSRRE